ASTLLERASKEVPDAANLHSSLALAYLGKGKSEQGISELETASKLDKKSGAASMLLVTTYMRLKQYDKALAAVNAMEKEDPKSASVQNIKGGVYMGMEDKAKARATFEHALQLEPTYFPAVASLALVDLMEKRPDLAQKHYEDFLKTDKKNMQVYTAL